MISLQAQARMLAQQFTTPVEFEFRFHAKRRWRFDVCYPDRKIAAEIDGAAWTAGRHTRGKGFIADQEKINEAQLLGWKVYRFVTDDLSNGRFLETMQRALEEVTGCTGGQISQSSRDNAG